MSGCAVTTPTTRGYTGHEMLDQICEINANARIYDPVIGRFTTPDPFVQDPLDGQGFNRYSYVENGPLSGIDPSGYASNGCPDQYCLNAGGTEPPGVDRCNTCDLYIGIGVEQYDLTAWSGERLGKADQGQYVSPSSHEASLSGTSRSQSVLGGRFDAGRSVARIDMPGVETVLVSGVANQAARLVGEQYPFGDVIRGSAQDFDWSIQRYRNAEGGYGVITHIYYRGKGAQGVKWAQSVQYYDPDTEPVPVVKQDMEPGSKRPYYDSANRLNLAAGEFYDDPQDPMERSGFMATTTLVQVSSGAYLGTFTWGFRMDVYGQVTVFPVTKIPQPGGR